MGLLESIPRPVVIHHLIPYFVDPYDRVNFSKTCKRARSYMRNVDLLTNCLCQPFESAQDTLNALTKHRCYGLIMRFIGSDVKYGRLNYLHTLFYAVGDRNLMDFFASLCIARSSYWNVKNFKIDIRILEYLLRVGHHVILTRVINDMCSDMVNIHVLFEFIRKHSYELDATHVTLIGRNCTYDPLIVHAIEHDKYHLFSGAIMDDNYHIIEEYITEDDFIELSKRDIAHWARGKLNKHWDRCKKRIKL